MAKITDEEIIRHMCEPLEKLLVQLNNTADAAGNFEQGDFAAQALQSLRAARSDAISAVNWKE
jgi:hypothetical protein